MNHVGVLRKAAHFGLLLCLAAGSVLAQGRPEPQSYRAAPAGGGEEVVRLKRDLVTLDVTVRDAGGRFVPGLDKSRFEVYDAAVRQTLAFFGDADTPATVGVIFDVSGSMRGRLDRSREALDRFVDTANPDDELFLVTFDERPRLACDLTTDAAGLSRALTNVAACGDTALYDALYVGVAKAAEGRHRKRALLVITDGEDTNSRYSFGEVRELLREADVQVYVIGIVDVLAGRRPASNGLAWIADLAEETGGRAFFPTDDGELLDSCSEVALELRHQYSLGYYPTVSARDGRWHKIKVRIAPLPGEPRLKVRAKAGYYGSPYGREP
jgi:Ca-activated chloride channel family protein